MDTKDFKLELKTVDDSGTFEGRLSVYNVVDLTGDVVEPGAFTKTLQEGSGTIPLCWQHEQADVIGVLSLSDSPEALNCKGKLVLSVPLARCAYDLLKAGAVRGLSIGFKSVKEIISGNVRRLKEIRLYEGSLVTIPANPETVVTAIKNLQAKAPDAEAIEAFRNARRDLQDFHRRLVEGD